MAQIDVNADSERTAYNKYEGIDELPYKCVEYLMEHNEMIWKLLKYNSSDAYKKVDLTQEEKGALVYKGQEDATLYRVFMDIGMPDVWTQEACVLRCSLFEDYPDNRTVGTVLMLFEMYSHYKIHHLDNYRIRTDMMFQQVVKTMNGVAIGGIGRLHFDKMGYSGDKMYNGGQTPFKGKFLIMSNKSA